ncbi:MAG: diguanylate cyclase [Thermomicrobiales bacterium]
MIEPTTFDEFYLRRYATAAVPLTLAAVVGSLPVLGIIRRAAVSPWWHTVLAVAAVVMLFLLAWLSRVYARWAMQGPVVACMAGFAGISSILASWEVWLTHRGVPSVLPTAMIIVLLAASFSLRYWQVAVSWVVVTAPILMFAQLETPLVPQQTSQFIRFIGLMIVTTTILYGAVIRVKWGYFRLIRQLREQSRTDALTGLLNRRAWLEDAEQALAARRSRDAMVLFLDVDHFKRTNDRHGHTEGDRLLLELAGVLRAVFGQAGSIGRLGGDEFVVFLPEAGHVPMADLVASLRDRAAAIPVTLSIGSAAMRERESLDEALARADSALLAAKAAGRDRYAGETDLAGLSAVA